jgi:hypothetical protein
MGGECGCVEAGTAETRRPEVILLFIHESLGPTAISWIAAERPLPVFSRLSMTWSTFRIATEGVAGLQHPGSRAARRPSRNSANARRRAIYEAAGLGGYFPAVEVFPACNSSSWKPREARCTRCPRSWIRIAAAPLVSIAATPGRGGRNMPTTIAPGRDPALRLFGNAIERVDRDSLQVILRSVRSPAVMRAARRAKRPAVV